MVKIPSNSLLKQVRVARTLVHDGEQRRVGDPGVRVTVDCASADAAIPEAVQAHYGISNQGSGLNAY